jgi:hypothetical protein
MRKGKRKIPIEKFRVQLVIQTVLINSFLSDYLLELNREKMS